MNRLQRRPKIRPRSGNGAGQVVVVVTAGAALALAALAAEGYVTAGGHEIAASGSGRATRHALAAAAPGQSDDDIQTGSILYMPNDGKLCRQLLFDNKNGQITDNGYVSCEEAAYNGLDGPKHWSAARIRVIATGFRGQ
jgi:hypothetical protein